jgi:hypothetical protein
MYDPNIANDPLLTSKIEVKDYSDNLNLGNPVTENAGQNMNNAGQGAGNNTVNDSIFSDGKDKIPDPPPPGGEKNDLNPDDIKGMSFDPVNNEINDSSVLNIKDLDFGLASDVITNFLRFGAPWFFSGFAKIKLSDIRYHVKEKTIPERILEYFEEENKVIEKTLEITDNEAVLFKKTLEAYLASQNVKFANPAFVFWAVIGQITIRLSIATIQFRVQSRSRWEEIKIKYNIGIEKEVKDKETSSDENKNQ